MKILGYEQTENETVEFDNYIEKKRKKKGIGFRADIKITDGKLRLTATFCY